MSSHAGLLPAFDCALWPALDDSERLALLSSGPSLRSQFNASPEHRHRQGLAPLTSLALAGSSEMVREALALGACPLAGSVAGDTLSILLNAGNSGIHLHLPTPAPAPSKPAIIEAFQLCWEACRPLLNPCGSEFVGAEFAATRKAWLAMEAFSNGLSKDLRAVGIDLPSELFIALQYDDMSWVRSAALAWGDPGDLRSLAEAGLDIVSPIRHGDAPGDIHSQWAWCGEWSCAPLERCAILLDYGNDPRLPDPNGNIPLDLLEASGLCDHIASGIRALLTARDEAALLGLDVPAAPSSRRHPL